MTPLHFIGRNLREGLSSVPLTAVRGLFLLTLVALLAWVMSLPRAGNRPQDDSPWTQDLRIWAAVALLLQILIYAFN